MISRTPLLFEVVMISRTPLLFEGLVAARSAVQAMRTRQTKAKKSGGPTPTQADWEKTYRASRRRLNDKIDKDGESLYLTAHDPLYAKSRRLADLGPQTLTNLITGKESVGDKPPGPGIRRATALIDPLDRTDRKEKRAKAAEQLRRAARGKSLRAEFKRQRQASDKEWGRNPARGKRYAAWQRSK